MRAGRERSESLYQEAVLLASRYKEVLDWDYIKTEAKYQGVSGLYEELRKAVPP